MINSEVSHGPRDEHEPAVAIPGGAVNVLEQIAVDDDALGILQFEQVLHRSVWLTTSP